MSTVTRVPTCVVCGKPRYQKHAERCAGRPPYAIARDIVDGGSAERDRHLATLRQVTAVLRTAGEHATADALNDAADFVANERRDVLRLAREYLAVCGIRP